MCGCCGTGTTACVVCRRVQLNNASLPNHRRATTASLWYSLTWERGNDPNNRRICHDELHQLRAHEELYNQFIDLLSAGGASRTEVLSMHAELTAN